MSSFFRPVLGDKDGLRCVVFSRVVDGVQEYGNIFEHAWWNNSFVNAVSERIYKNPSRIAWVEDLVGIEDYDIPVSEEASSAYIPSVKEVWGEVVRPIDVTSTDFTLDNKYLVNHDSKEYIDSVKYKANSVTICSWISHPIPLLTLAGNEQVWIGFYADNNDRDRFRALGSWTWCVISIEDEPPEGYSKLEHSFPITVGRALQGYEL